MDDIFHLTRHTFATLITLEQSVPIETVSKMLKHTNVSMTECYAKVTPHSLPENCQSFYWKRVRYSFQSQAFIVFCIREVCWNV